MIEAGLAQGYPGAELAEDYSGNPVNAVTSSLTESEGYSYLNAATCPDCGAGMVRLGNCFSCPLCGFGGCGV